MRRGGEGRSDVRCLRGDVRCGPWNADISFRCPKARAHVGVRPLGRALPLSERAICRNAFSHASSFRHGRIADTFAVRPVLEITPTEKSSVFANVGVHGLACFVLNSPLGSLDELRTTCAHVLSHDSSRRRLQDALPQKHRVPSGQVLPVEPLEGRDRGCGPIHLHGVRRVVDHEFAFFEGHILHPTRAVCGEV